MYSVLVSTDVSKLGKSKYFISYNIITNYYNTLENKHCGENFSIPTNTVKVINRPFFKTSFHLERNCLCVFLRPLRENLFTLTPKEFLLCLLCPVF